MFAWSGCDGEILTTKLYCNSCLLYTSVKSNKVSAEDLDPQDVNEQKHIDGDEESSDPSSANLGGIINLMAVDAFKVSEVCAYPVSYTHLDVYKRQR